ncbi:MAG: methyltransferase domain-containing protein [Desulfobulbaceae bacterium]|nr:methyltransferase domain-containing protein [Desulfobulbaceae bacterium]
MKRYLHPQSLVAGLIFLLLLLQCGPVPAQEQLSIREKRRQLIPLDKLKVFLEAPKRVQTMQPERVLDALGVRQGEIAADIGAGTGFFSFYLAQRVGDEGRVYAVEIEDELVDFIREKMEARGVTNIVPVKSSEGSPRLPQSCCDKILIANTYIYFENPVAFMENVRTALRPGGLVGIIELDAQKTQSKRKLLLGTRGRVVREVVDEMQRAGFILSNSYGFLESRFYLVFRLQE